MQDLECKVVDLSLIGKDEKDGIICATEKALYVMTISPEGNIIRKEMIPLKGEAISMRISKLSWNRKNVLVLTRKDYEFQLWAFSADLTKQTLLLQGNDDTELVKLNEDNFFDFIEARSQTNETKTEQSSQLQLACFRTSTYYTHELILYDMPKPLENENEVEETDSFKPLNIKGSSILESESLYFDSAKILQFMKI